MHQGSYNIKFAVFTAAGSAIESKQFICCNAEGYNGWIGRSAKRKIYMIRLFLTALFLVCNFIHSMDNKSKNGLDVFFEIEHEITKPDEITKKYSIKELNEAKICGESYITSDEGCLKRSKRLSDQKYWARYKERHEKVLSLINKAINQISN